MWGMLPEDTRLLSGPYGPGATYHTEWIACPDCEGSGIDILQADEDRPDLDQPCPQCHGAKVIEVEVEDAYDDERGRFDYDD